MTAATESRGTRAVARDREDDLVFPPDNLDELLDLGNYLDQRTEPAVLVGPDGEQFPLPEQVYRVLRQVIDSMRSGMAIMVAPQGMLLTTQEAAEFLGVSRPTLVKLLEDGAIPFERPNRHRRVRLQDLVDYQVERRRERRDALNRLTEEASELDLYDDPPPDYAAALAKARRRRSKSGG